MPTFLVIALIAGARFPGGVVGIGVTVLAAVLPALIFRRCPMPSRC